MKVNWEMAGEKQKCGEGGTKWEEERRKSGRKGGKKEKEKAGGRGEGGAEREGEGGEGEGGKWEESWRK